MGRKRNTEKTISKISFNVAGLISDYLQYRLATDPQKRNLTEILTSIIVDALRADVKYHLEKQKCQYEERQHG